MNRVSEEAVAMVKIGFNPKIASVLVNGLYSRSIFWVKSLKKLI